MRRFATALVALVAFVSLATGTLTVPARAANPATGSVSDLSPNATWTGQSYLLGATTLPEQCPPTTDPLNALCDHFFLSISVSSASGGTTLEEVSILAPPPGTYEVRVVPFLVFDSGYDGQASLLFSPGGPTPNPILPTGGIAFAPSVVVDAQRTEGEPIVHVDRAGNIWESGPWGTTTVQSFIHKSVDGGDSFHIVSATGLRPDTPPGGGATDVTTDDQGFAYFVDLEALANLGVAVSNDGGNTWRKNAAAVA